MTVFGTIDLAINLICQLSNREKWLHQAMEDIKVFSDPFHTHELSLRDDSVEWISTRVEYNH